MKSNIFRILFGIVSFSNFSGVFVSTIPIILLLVLYLISVSFVLPLTTLLDFSVIVSNTPPTRFTPAVSIEVKSL